MTASVARVTGPREVRSAQRIPYAEASRVLLRDSVLDGDAGPAAHAGTGRRSRCRTWRAPRASAARRSTTSSARGRAWPRDTRCGWPTGWSTRSTGAITGNVGDIYAAFLEGFRAFFAESAADPLVISLLTGVAKPDLLQLITTDSAPDHHPLLGSG